MIDINELRRLAQAAMTGPDGVSLNWVKLLQDFQKEANPAAINELLDRLEEAESDALEQARLNGMGASREAALMAKLEAAEKERDELRAELETERMRLAACGVVAFANTPDSAKQAREMRPEYWSASCGDVARMVDENIKLRAKIEQMEQQEPVVEVGKLYMPTWCGFDSVTSIIKRHGLKIGSKLYLAPGAKGE